MALLKQRAAERQAALDEEQRQWEREREARRLEREARRAKRMDDLGLGKLDEERKKREEEERKREEERKKKEEERRRDPQQWALMGVSHRRLRSTLRSHFVRVFALLVVVAALPFAVSHDDTLRHSPTYCFPSHLQFFSRFDVAAPDSIGYDLSSWHLGQPFEPTCRRRSCAHASSLRSPRR